MYQRILVAVDGSRTSNDALAHALRLARSFHATVRLVHAVEELSWLATTDSPAAATVDVHALLRATGEQVLAAGLATARAEGVAGETMLLDAPGERLGEAVARAAKLWNADLVVVGTHGRRGLGRLLLGSGAEQVVRAAPAPVLVVRTPEGSD